MSKFTILIRLFFMFSLAAMQSELAAQAIFTKLVWADEFNYTGLPDSNRWAYNTGNGCPDVCGWGNNELQYYTSRLQNARVQKGRLIIEAKKEDTANMHYTSARLVTKNKGDWQYGRVEVKAKIPAGRGMWPAIWMLPTKWEYGNWPNSGEIDIMENVGYWPDSALSTVHTGAYNGMLNTQKTAGIHRNGLSKQFHVYAMEWQADSICFFIDKVKYNVFKNDHTGIAAWPFDKSFHLLLNIAVGGNWGGKFGVDDAIFPQKMEIEYVRVYQ